MSEGLLLKPHRVPNPRELHEPRGITWHPAQDENYFDASNHEMVMVSNTGSEFEKLIFKMPDGSEFEHQVEPGATAAIWFGTSGAVDPRTLLMAYWVWPDGTIRFHASSSHLLVAVLRHDV